MSLSIHQAHTEPTSHRLRQQCRIHNQGLQPHPVAIPRFGSPSTSFTHNRRQTSRLARPKLWSSRWMQNLVLKYLLTIRAQGGGINSTLQKPGISAYNLVTEEREPQAVTVTILHVVQLEARGRHILIEWWKKIQAFLEIYFPYALYRYAITYGYIHTYICNKFLRQRCKVNSSASCFAVHLTRGAPVPLPAKSRLIFCSRIRVLP